MKKLLTILIATLLMGFLIAGPVLAAGSGEAGDNILVPIKPTELDEAAAAVESDILTKGATDQFDWHTPAELGLYYSGGTDVPMADGGTGQSLTDPAANKILGWDDTDNDMRFFTIGSGLSYDQATDTLTATGSATAWDDITNPDANKSLDFTDYYTDMDFGDTDHDMFTLFLTGAFGDVSGFVIEQKTGDPTDGTLLELILATGETDPDFVSYKVGTSEKYKVDATGKVTAAGGIETGPSATAKVGFLDSDCPGTDKDVGNIEVAYIDGADGAENADILFRVTQGGVEDTLVAQFDESADRWEFPKDVNLASGKNYMINGSQISSDNLSDTASIGMLDEAETISGNWVNTTNPWAVNEGGTGAATFTDGGILLGSGTGAITALGAAANGQIPIGDGTTDPVLATITGTANEITVTNGVGTITLDIPDSPTLVTPTFTTSMTIGAATIDETELEILDGATLSTTELNYVDGVTSAIQTQLDAKTPGSFGAAEDKTIATGSITVTIGQANINLIGEGAAADDLTEIVAVAEGDIVVLKNESAGSYTITVKDNGYMKLANDADFLLDGIYDTITLVCDTLGANDIFREVSRSSNGS